MAPGDVRSGAFALGSRYPQRWRAWLRHPVHLQRGFPIIEVDHAFNNYPHLNLADAWAEPFGPEFLIRDRPAVAWHSGATQRLSFSEDVPASKCDRAVDKLEAMELRVSAPGNHGQSRDRSFADVQRGM